MGSLDAYAAASAAKPILMECPKCHQPGFINAWPRIVSTVDKEAERLLLEGKLFKYHCPVCETSANVVYDCLYHDVENKTYLFYTTQPNNEAENIERVKQLLSLERSHDGEKASDYQARIVLHSFEFCEKARILKDGYDDRAIELMKVAIKRGMIEDPNCNITSRDILVYERTIPETKGISFIVLGTLGDVIGVVQGYEYCKRYLAERLDQIQDEHYFNAAWANKFLD